MQNIKQLEGVWRSQGYNRLWACSQSGFKFYDLTRISCVENQRLSHNVKNGSMDEFAKLFDRFEFTSADMFSMYQKGGITRYNWNRQVSLPAALIRQTTEKGKNPEFNFEVFWNYFAENYAFFNLRQVNWEQVYKTYRPRVNPDTTEEVLMNIFSEILHLLGDNHVSITAGDVKIESSKPNALLLQWQKEFGQDANIREIFMTGRKNLVEFVMSDILQGEGHNDANKKVLWGKVTPKIGYFMVEAMAGFAGNNNTLLTEDLSVLDRAISRVMADLKDVDAVIIDARFNPGGHDAASLLIANRFADKKRVAFTKKAVWNDSFTEEQEIYIFPEGDFQFTRPVVFLTSEATISAAEIFTLCMMSLPHVTRMGEPTQGVLSDILGKTLPNGWTLGLSNEIYTACDGELYEGRGIPPHITMPIYDTDNFYPTLKAEIDEAVKWLEERL